MKSCESQSINLAQEKDETSASCQQNIINSRQLPQRMTLQQMERVIQIGNDSEFQAIVPLLAVEMNKYQQLYSNKNYHYRLMKYFYRTFKAINENNQECQHQLVFLMSIMAQITQRNMKVKLPFTRKIVQAMLSFDENSLNHITYGCRIIKVLTVLLQNLIKQGRAVVKLGVESEVKNGLLRLLGKVDDLSTLQILLRSVKTLLIEAKINITKEQLQKNGILQGLISHFGQILTNKCKIYLYHLAFQRQKFASSKTLKDLIDQP